MTQPTLFPTQPRMHGETFDEPQDGSRLRKQLAAVKALMLDGHWRSLAEIAASVKAPEASVSARLRDLRKASMGGYTVERRRRSVSQHEYRIKE